MMVEYESRGRWKSVRGKRQRDATSMIHMTYTGGVSSCTFVLWFRLVGHLDASNSKMLLMNKDMLWFGANQSIIWKLVTFGKQPIWKITTFGIAKNPQGKTEDLPVWNPPWDSKISGSKDLHTDKNKKNFSRIRNELRSSPRHSEIFSSLHDQVCWLIHEKQKNEIPSKPIILATLKTTRILIIPEWVRSGVKLAFIKP